MKEFIMDLSELKGKTIETCRCVDYGTSLAIVFTDGTCAYFSDIDCGDGYDLELKNAPSKHSQLKAGIISEEEYAPIKLGLLEVMRKDELRLLSKLKKKYPDKPD